MGRINNKIKYPVKVSPRLTDYFIGSDIDNNGKTVNFEVASIVSLIESLGQQNRIISGKAIWIPDTLSFYITEVIYFLNGQLYITEPTTITLSDADPDDPRIDVIAVTSEETVYVEEGEPSPDPIKPTLPNGTEYLELTFVNIAAGATVPTGASSEVIYNEFLGAPDEWTVTEDDNTYIKTNDTESPQSGTKDIKIEGTFSSATMTFEASAPKNVVSSDTINFYILLKSEFDLTQKINFTFLNGSDESVSNNKLITELGFLFNPNLVGQYQLVSIPLSSFSFTSSQYQKLEVSFSGFNDYKVLMDNFSLVSGINNPPPMDFVPTGGYEGTGQDLYDLIQSLAQMEKAIYDPNNIEADAFDMDNMVDGVNKLAMTQAERDKLNGLDTAVILKGDWDASLGTFPASTEAGWSYLVSVGGTVSGQIFSIGDRLISILDGASTTVYAGNWIKADYTDVSFSSEVAASSEKTSVNDSDLFGILDSAASFITKKLTFANIKSTIKTYTDTLYVALANFLEEKINGTAIEDLDMHTNYSVNLSSAAHGRYRLTGNTNLTFTNTPSVGRTICRTYVIRSTTAQTLTIVNTHSAYGSYKADGSINLITVVASNTTTSGLELHISFSQPN
jgi:hypothetical protein